MFAFTLVNSDVREVLMEIYCNTTNNMIDVCVCVRVYKKAAFPHQAHGQVSKGKMMENDDSLMDLL